MDHRTSTDRAPEDELLMLYQAQNRIFLDRRRDEQGTLDANRDMDMITRGVCQSLLKAGFKGISAATIRERAIDRMRDFYYAKSNEGLGTSN